MFNSLVNLIFERNNKISFSLLLNYLNSDLNHGKDVNELFKQVIETINTILNLNIFNQSENSILPELILNNNNLYFIHSNNITYNTFLFCLIKSFIHHKGSANNRLSLLFFKEVVLDSSIDNLIIESRLNNFGLIFSYSNYNKFKEYLFKSSNLNRPLESDHDLILNSTGIKIIDKNEYDTNLESIITNNFNINIQHGVKLILD